MKQILLLLMFLTTSVCGFGQGIIDRKLETIITNLALKVNTDVFEKLYSDFYYVLPTVSFVSSSSGTYEKGATVSSINLGFTVNKSMTTRTYSNAYVENLGTGSNNSLVLTTNITSTKTFTVNVTDARTNSTSASQTLTFKNRKYYGVSGLDTNTLSNANILALTTAWESKGASGTVTPTDQYIYVIYPVSFGTCTSFTLGGFGTSAWPLSTRNVTNSSGYVESFYVYKSEYKLTTALGISYDIH
jgi:hypothetical protein